MVVTAVDPAQRGERVVSLRHQAMAITGVYAVLATLWIYTSDQALEALAPDPQALVAWSVYKGVAFVLVTSVLLFMLMRRSFGSIERAYWKLKTREAEIARVNRWLAALSQVNHAIAREREPQSLLPRACAAMVEHGGLGCAWIASRSPDGRLSCAAIASSAAGPAALPEALDFDFAAQVIDSQGSVVIGGLQRDAAPASPWHRRAAARGHRCVAAWTLRSRGVGCGCLVVLSDTEDAFHGKELALMEEAAAGLSFALDRFAAEDAKHLAQQAAEHEQSFSAAMLESLPGVFYLYDEAGRFLRWNRNFSRVTGYPDSEIACMHPLQFFRAADRDGVAARIAEVFECGESSVEAGFLTKGGRAIPYLFTGRRIVLEGRDCLVGMGIDITAREEAVRALRELNETLEARVAQRTSELSAALVRAESADRLKSAFLATMSHELRTPLNSIIGFTGILLRGLAGPLNPEQLKQLGMVRASARHLLELINDVLDLSKIEAGQLQIRSGPFAVRESVERVLGLVQPLARGKQLELLCSEVPDIHMHSDRRRVEQILLNLLNNAIKFTDRGSIRLDVERAEGDPSSGVVFRIRDTGIGIRAEDLPLLFRPFQQVDDGLSRQHEGTGLGLAICRRLAQLMGGGIDVESRLAMGSTFTVTLPLEAP